MFLKQKSSGDRVEILDMQTLADPFKGEVSGRLHVGEELQDATEFNKSDLCFLSDEALPQCWVNPNYRN